MRGRLRISHLRIGIWWQRRDLLVRRDCREWRAYREWLVLRERRAPLGQRDCRVWLGRRGLWGRKG